MDATGLTALRQAGTSGPAMSGESFLALPDSPGTRGRMDVFFAADPAAILEVAAEIAETGRVPAEALSVAAADQHAGLASADPARLRAQFEHTLLGREVDVALEWLHQVGALRLLVPELEATVDLVQETGRQHKDVWAHTKQVVKQTVRRPLVRWAALLHDIGKVPTRTFTPEGVHFHGHAEVGARMFDKIHGRFAFPRDERQTIRFLVKHHLRTNKYGPHWTDSAVRRFHRDMGPHYGDLLDLSRADITSKRPGRRKQLLEQIAALADRADRLAAADAILPPLPGGVGNAIMEAFQLAPSRLIGDLKRTLEQHVADGTLAARREDAYYVAYLARLGLVPGLQPELRDRLIAAGGALDAEPGDPDAGDDVERPDLGVDPDDPEHASLLCGADPANPCTDPDHDHS